MFLKVDVNGVRPIPGEVREQPLLHAVLLHGKPEFVAVHELTVNGPLAVQAVELEGAHDSGLRIGAGELVERRIGRRVHAAVLDVF